MYKALSICAALTCAATSLTANPMDDIVSVEVIPGWETPSGSQMAGLRISLAPGWKTYWRSPGDAGIPPIINFAGSGNVAATRMQWPVPEVFFEHGIRSIGYHNEVVVPVEMTPENPNDPIVLSGEMQIGVCEEICVPAHLTFEAAIPADGGRTPAIVAALINRPLSQEEAGVTAATCAFQPHENGILIQTTVGLPHTGGEEEVVIEAGDPHIWVSEPDVARTGDQLTATSYMVHSAGEAFADPAVERRNSLGKRRKRCPDDAIRHDQGTE